MMVILLLPLCLLFWFVHAVKAVAQIKQKSYFSKSLNGKHHLICLQKIRCYSFFNLLVLIALSPCLKLSNFWDKKLFLPKPRRFTATPNQTAAILINQVMGNLKYTSMVAENNDAKYLFALQPSLAFTGPATEDDKVFYDSREKTRMWGFPLTLFIKTYFIIKCVEGYKRVFSKNKL